METTLHAQIAQAIRARDIRTIMEIMFEATQPVLKNGFHHESDLWDFKKTAPGHGRANEIAWANIAADVLAFHNKDGGIIFFGIDDPTHSFCGSPTDLDSKKFNDKLRKYVGDAFWVTYSKEFGKSGLHLGVVLIPKRGFKMHVVMTTAPVANAGDKPYFEAGDLCVRESDETKIMRGPKAEQFLLTHNLPSSDYKYAVDRPGFRILREDYRQFVYREKLCSQIRKALQDPKSFITVLLGFGGLGKTALATWAVLDAYERKEFDFIVSLSAKDRELRGGGIQRVEAELSSFDSLLDAILDVMGFSDEKKNPTDEKALVVNEIIKGEKVLLYVDNLETVDDSRIFSFLEELPIGVRVLATSRKARLRRGIFPVDVGPMSENEASEFLDYCYQRKDASFVERITAAESKLILEACSYAPLLIEWFVANAKAPELAVKFAQEVKMSGKVDDELIEFCFRRIDLDLEQNARRVLRVISLFLSPMPIEQIAAGAELSLTEADDCCQDLIEAGLLQQDYSKQFNDTVYFLLPVTQRFAYHALRQDVGVEHAIQKALSRWYDARDVTDPREQKIVSEIRRGVREPEAVLVEYAESMRMTGHFGEAEKFFSQALQRNPRSWKALRGLGEVHRKEGRIAQALKYYELAGTYSPKKGPDRALIFREWGMLLRECGTPDAAREAASKLEIALKETPNDVIARHALGNMYLRLYAYDKATEILRPLLESKFPETRTKTVPLLRECYEKAGRKYELLELKTRYPELF
jgi:tetratricopeptide (TPR) repeat protein